MNIKETLLFTITLISIISFGWFAFLVQRNELVHFDNSIISIIQGLESSLLTRVMKGFTWIGSAWGVALISLFTLFTLRRNRSEWILFIVVVAGTVVFNQVLKEVFQRARPSLYRLVEIGGLSFPSTHAMGAVALYGVLGYLLWRHATSLSQKSLLISISLLMILFIGVSRIYLGVHYPTDIMGGYFASAFWLGAAILFFQRQKKYDR